MFSSSHRPVFFESLESRSLLSAALTEPLAGSAPSVSAADVAAGDVGVQVAGVTLPSSINVGDTVSGTVNVLVTNFGTDTTPDGATIDLSVSARLIGAGDGSGDVPLGVFLARDIANLPGEGTGSAAFALSVSLPSNLAAGTYRIVVVGSPSESIADANAANDFAVSAFTFDVEPVSNVGVTVSGVTLPAAIDAGQTPSGTVSVSVRNKGQAATPAGSTIDFSVRVRPADAVDGASDISLGTFSARSIAGLGPDESAAFAFDVVLPAGLNAGAYHIVVVGVPSAGVADGNEADNTGTSAYTLTVTGTKDVTLEITGVTLPTAVRAGQTPSGVVTMIATNSDDTVLPAGATVDLSIRARLTSAVDDSGDIVLATYKNELIAGLGHGASVTFSRNATLPANLPGGTYRIVVVGSLSGSIGDSNELNDTAVSAFTFSLTGPDLTVAVSDITLPTNLLAGRSATGRVVATVTNSDTVAVPQNRVVDLQIRLAPIEGGEQILLTTLHGVRAGGMAAGETKTYKLSVTFKKTFAPNTYRIIGVIDPTNRVAESDETNNVGASDGVYTIALPYSDLTARVITGNLPIPIPAGKTFKTTVTISIVNSGNVVILNKTTIDVQIVLHEVASGADTVLLTIPGVSVNQLGAARPLDKKKTVTLPPLAAGLYTIVGIVDVNNTIAEINEGNNSASTVEFAVG